MLGGASVDAGEFVLTETDEGVSVTLDGKPLTNYLKRSGSKPILHPLIGPTGDQLTRNWPVADKKAGEKTDHPHHRSVWLTHGDVNGTDFWLEKEGVGGVIEHAGFGTLSGGETGKLVAEAAWKTPQGKTLLDQRSVFEFSTWNGGTIIDCDFTLTPHEEDITFGDTKEGTFGVRVGTGITVDDKLGGKIVTSEGRTNAAAWAKPAKWVDYYGPVGPAKDGVVKDDQVRRVAGVAILEHPTSFRHPTYWHVRTYGLFAANPFGLHDFGAGDKGAGNHTLKRGEKLVLRYRVYLHEGDEIQARVEDLYKEYAGDASK